MPTEVPKIHQLHHLEEKHPLNRCDLPVPFVLLLPSTKIRMRWEHQFLLTERRWVSCLSPIQSHPFGLVLRAFPNAQLNGSSPLPMFTSTPISGQGSRDTSQVKVSFKCPSKTVNKTLSSAYQFVGKALAYGVASQIAGAIMNCQPLRQHKWKSLINKRFAKAGRQVHQNIFPISNYFFNCQLLMII